MLKKMTKKQKKQFYKIVVAFVLLIVGVILPIPELYKLIFFIPGYLIVGYDVLAKAGKNITKGQVFVKTFCGNCNNWCICSCRSIQKE